MHRDDGFKFHPVHSGSAFGTCNIFLKLLLEHLNQLLALLENVAVSSRIGRHVITGRFFQYDCSALIRPRTSIQEIFKDVL
jgi:hypothetical protein